MHRSSRGPGAVLGPRFADAIAVSGHVYDVDTGLITTIVKPRAESVTKSPSYA